MTASRRAAPALFLALALAAPAAAKDEPKPFAALHWRHLGPIGNRVIAVAGEPGNPNVAYIGAASGGIFKTIDGGTQWEPVFDDQPASSVSALAIAPSDHNVLYAGTGETFIRSNISMGNGVYRSTDAGKTWTHVGLDATGRIGRIVVDPRNPDVAFAAALGHAYGPQPDRGVFRTTDGGKTWQKVLFVDENTGVVDLAMDPTNPRILFAAAWQLVIHTWGRQSGGPGSGIYVSRDGGDTWTRLVGHGLPETPMGKIAVGVARTDPSRVYALVETSDPGLYRSDDGGESWRLVNQTHDLMERPHYYTRFAVAPDDANRLYFVSVRFSMSLDGGLSLVEDPPRGGGDTHDVWIDPTNPDRMMVGDDGGVNITTNRGKTWHRSALPIAQMYHVYTDDRVPYNVYGNRQDDSSYEGPAINREGGGDIPVSLWHSIGGCESGFAVPDPVEPDIVWSGCYDGGLQRYDDRTRQAREVRVWPEAAYGWPPKDLKYRWQWTFPIAISPHDHHTVYVGSQYVHRTTDGGQSWTVISPDLTRNDKEKQESSGGLVVDNLMVEEACVLFAIAESPVEKGLLWAGTKDGLVQVTRDGGAHWTNVTASIPGMPAWSTVSNIEPSRFDAGTAYVTVDNHQSADFAPYVYETSDYGRTWRSLAAGIPRSVFSYAHVVREDPVRRGMLYLGTENGIYVSWDDGASWTSLQANLPHAPVAWLTVQPRFHDLVVATYGRGFWVLDDVSPLRAFDPRAKPAAARLFPPRTAWRFRQTAETQSHPDGQGDGENVPYGIDLTYVLPEGAKDVSLTVTDAKGQVVRTIEATPHEPKFLRPRRPSKTVSRLATKAPGLNRVWWDLRYEPTKEARLLTKPLGHPHTTFGKEGWRPLVTWDLDVWGGFLGPLAPPGTYTVTLRADGTESAQPLTIEKDPYSTGTADDVASQVKTSLELRRDIDAAVGMINAVEVLRKQLADLRSALDGGAPDVAKAAEALDAKALAVSGELYDVNLTGAREDAFRSPMRLYGRLGALASDVGASSADFPPTNQQVEVKALLEERLAQSRRALDALLATDVAAFNALAREKGMGRLLTPGP